MKNLVLRLKIWKDNKGQDLIEYALMAGFVAVAAGAVAAGAAGCSEGASFLPQPPSRASPKTQGKPRCINRIVVFMISLCLS